MSVGNGVSAVVTGKRAVLYGSTISTAIKGGSKGTPETLCELPAGLVPKNTVRAVCADKAGNLGAVEVQAGQPNVILYHLDQMPASTGIFMSMEITLR